MYRELLQGIFWLRHHNDDSAIMAFALVQYMWLAFFTLYFTLHIKKVLGEEKSFVPRVWKEGVEENEDVNTLAVLLKQNLRKSFRWGKGI